MKSEYIIEITEENFDSCVMQEEKPILLDFWASWCGPCRMVAPQLEMLSNEAGNQLIIGKVNIDEQGELAQRFGIMSIPALVLMKDGRLIDTMVGAAPKDEIKRFIADGLTAMETYNSRKL